LLGYYRLLLAVKDRKGQEDCRRWMILVLLKLNSGKPELKIEYLWSASTRLSSAQAGGSILFVIHCHKSCADII
jgi:hypothetical protein